MRTMIALFGMIFTCFTAAAFAQDSNTSVAGSDEPQVVVGETVDDVEADKLFLDGGCGCGSTTKNK